MPAITVTDLNNAKLDVDHIAEVATSTASTSTDRLGNTKKTLKGVLDYIETEAASVLDGLGYSTPVAYTSGLSMTISTQTVEYLGETYAPKSSEIPFTTSGTFETSKFRLIQGVTAASLASTSGANLVGTSDGRSLGAKDEAKSVASSLSHWMAKMQAGLAVNIAAYGDSTTAGVDTTGYVANPVDGSGNAIGTTDHNLNSPNSWPVKLQALLRKMFGNNNIDVHNAGYSGQRLDNAWAYNNYDTAITDNPYYGQANICFIAFGLNDIGIAGSQIETHKSESMRLCKKLLDEGTLPVLVGCDAMWLVSPNIRDSKESSRELDEVKKAVALELGIPFIDMGTYQKEWLEINNDGYRWANNQLDGLHFSDNGHAFKSTVFASVLFKDTFTYKGTIPQQIQLLDSRAGRTITASNNTDTTNMKQGVSFYQTTTGDEVLATAWVWNTNPNAELIYRGLNGEGFDSSSYTNPPVIKVSEYIQGSVVSEKTPAGAGTQASVYSLSELPYRITRLPYGLVEVQYITGTDTSGNHWVGSFELWSTVNGSKEYSNCLVTGDYQVVCGPVSEVSLIPEQTDGSNVFGLTLGEFVDIYAETSLARRTGLVIAHANSWGSGRAYGSKGFLYLFRGVTDIATLGVGTLEPNGTVSYSVLASLPNINLVGTSRFRVRMYRDGVNRIVKVYPSWNVSDTPETVTLDSTMACIPLAGAVGGVFFEPETPGINRQTTIHKIYKQQGLLANDVSTGVEVVQAYNPVTEIAGSAVAVSAVGSVVGTTETTLVTATIPRLSKDAMLNISLFMQAAVGSGGSKTYRVKLNGVTLWSGANVSSVYYSADVAVRNRGVTNSQFCSNGDMSGASTASHAVTSVDTSTSTALTITCQLANSADTATLEAYSVKLVKP